MKLLMIGTGPNWPETKRQFAERNIEATGLDILPGFFPDILHNIQEGLSFEDNTFDEIVIEHVLEHIEHKYGDLVMNEMYRVLKPGGVVKIEVPYWRDDIAVEAAGHIRLFAMNSFINYYSNPYAKEMGQCQFSKVVYHELAESGRSGEVPARVVKIGLQK